MRTFEASRKRWNVLVAGNGTGSDLWQAVREQQSEESPCVDGLRSVCWKAFLLYGVISQTSWPKKLSDSRGAYESLRQHLLRYTDRPHDLQSTIDPLTDDLASPWSTLRQDEVNREEISQDVERCMQEMPFFQEGSTKKKLLDILFIYSKLHPDLGYRQGMHELLAPILWVVDCDAIVSSKSGSTDAGDPLMSDVLDRDFIEHDAFALFCAVMQTEKSFYETGDSTSPIVDRSRRIHDEYLAEVDPELAIHLRQIEILPQIFLLRWIRLLFGREFSLKDTLSIWDVLFAENLSSSLVDMTCLIMLLRIREQLLRANHTEALQLLLRYEPPPPPNGTWIMMQNAMFLDQNRTSEGGAAVIARYSGLETELPTQRLPKSRRPPTLRLDKKDRKTLNRSSPKSGSSINSPARFLSPPNGFAALFQEMPGILQKRTENWKVSGAVREAVGEVRRNMNSLQSANSPPKNRFGSPGTHSPHQHVVQDTMDGLSRRLSALERRNQALAGMLGEALEELRAQQQPSDSDHTSVVNDELNTTLAKLQFVQIYLADSETPLLDPGLLSPQASPRNRSSVGDVDKFSQTVLPDGPDVVVGATQREGKQPGPTSSPLTADGTTLTSSAVARGQERERVIEHEEKDEGMLKSGKLSASHPRPTLAQSPLSWILGDGHHRSDFVSSSTPPPEERRDSVPKATPKRLFPVAKDEENRDESESESDGFTMSSLPGSLTRR